jgi:hypothetical protein
MILRFVWAVTDPQLWSITPSSFHIAAATTVLLLLAIPLMHNPVVMSENTDCIYLLLKLSCNLWIEPGTFCCALQCYNHAVCGRAAELWKAVKAKLVLEMSNYYGLNARLSHFKMFTHVLLVTSLRTFWVECKTRHFE